LLQFPPSFIHLLDGSSSEPLPTGHAHLLWVCCTDKRNTAGVTIFRKKQTVSSGRTLLSISNETLSRLTRGRNSGIWTNVLW
jgi:hypothetical protein